MWGFKNHRKILRSELRVTLADAARNLAMQEANLVRAKLEIVGCEQQIVYQQARVAATKAALDTMDREDELKDGEKAAQADARKWSVEHGRSIGSTSHGHDPQRHGWGAGFAGNDAVAST